MYEVELKMAVNHTEIERRLDALGAQRQGQTVQEDTYFDAPHRRFAETDEALRIREESGDESERIRLTYKGPLVDDRSKTRLEHETEVAEIAPLRAILESLGFTPAVVVRKVRTRFSYDGYTVALDRVEELGEYLEVETEVPGAELDAAREGAADVLAALDLDVDDQIRTSYLGLLLASRDVSK